MVLTSMVSCMMFLVRPIHIIMVKAVVKMGTREDIEQKEKKTRTVRTAKSMDTSLNTVTARRSMVKTSRTVTRGTTKKRSSGKNKNTTKKKNRKELM